MAAALKYRAALKLFPGCVNIELSNSVLLPAVGKQNGTFSPNFTQPGKHSLEVPCKVAKVFGTPFSVSLDGCGTPGIARL